MGGVNETSVFVGARRPNGPRSPGPLADLAAKVPDLPVGMVEIDALGRVRHANPAAVALLDPGNQGVVGRPWDTFCLPEAQAPIRQLHHELRSGFRSSYRTEKALIGPGTLTWVEEAGALCTGAPDSKGHILICLVDLRKHNDAEQELRRRADELEQSNRALESFAYSVSHDLRAPLRAIEGYTSLILLDHERSLVPAARQHFDRVRSAASRMGRLVDGLLQLSRVGRAEMDRQPVDVTQVVGALLQELRDADPQRRAEFAVAPGMVAEGDPALVRVVLQNLLQNAWKFTKGRDVTRIHVEDYAWKGRRVFVVRDNGVGFEPTQADQIFQPFHRLHPPAQYEGSGIGLATVRRIVDRHGGRVWAEARPGAGAEFHFTLEPMRGLPA